MAADSAVILDASYTDWMNDRLSMDAPRDVPLRMRDISNDERREFVGALMVRFVRELDERKQMAAKKEIIRKMLEAQARKKTAFQIPAGVKSYLPHVAGGAALGGLLGYSSEPEGEDPSKGRLGRTLRGVAVGGLAGGAIKGIRGAVDSQAAKAVRASKGRILDQLAAHPDAPRAVKGLNESRKAIPMETPGIVDKIKSKVKGHAPTPSAGELEKLYKSSAVMRLLIKKAISVPAGVKTHLPWAAGGAALGGLAGAAPRINSDNDESWGTTLRRMGALGLLGGVSGGVGSLAIPRSPSLGGEIKDLLAKNELGSSRLGNAIRKAEEGLADVGTEIPVTPHIKDPDLTNKIKEIRDIVGDNAEPWMKEHKAIGEAARKGKGQSSVAKKMESPGNLDAPKADDLEQWYKSSALVRLLAKKAALPAGMSPAHLGALIGGAGGGLAGLFGAKATENEDDSYGKKLIKRLGMGAAGAVGGAYLGSAIPPARALYGEGGGLKNVWKHKGMIGSAIKDVPLDAAKKAPGWLKGMWHGTPKAAADTSDEFTTTLQDEMNQVLGKAAMVKRKGDKWELHTSDGSRVLGTHDTARKAYAQEKAIEMSKARKKTADLIPGGKSDNKSDKLYNKKQLSKGVKVELEHVNSKAKAKEIAKDHLEEQREAGKMQNYYDKLQKMEGKHADGPIKAALFGLFGGKKEPKHGFPDEVINHLAEKYQMDPQFMHNDIAYYAKGDPEALERHTAKWSDAQRIHGGPGIPWDAKRWGESNDVADSMGPAKEGAALDAAPMTDSPQGDHSTPFSPDEIGQYRQHAEGEKSKGYRTSKMLAYPGLGAALGGLLLSMKHPRLGGGIAGAGALAAGAGGLHALDTRSKGQARDLIANMAESGRIGTPDLEKYVTLDPEGRHEGELHNMFGRELKDVHPALRQEIVGERSRYKQQMMMDQLRRMHTEQQMDRMDRYREKEGGIKDWFKSPFQRAAKSMIDPVAKATGHGVERIIEESAKGGVRGTQAVAKDIGERLTGASPALAASMGLGGAGLAGTLGAVSGGMAAAREGDENDPEYKKKILHEALKRGLVSGVGGGVTGAAVGGMAPYFGGRMLRTMGNA